MTSPNTETMLRLQKLVEYVEAGNAGDWNDSWRAAAILKLRDCLPVLKSLLGEAQGADELPFMPTTNAAKPTERMVDEALDGFNTMPETEGLRAQVEHAVERAMWACPVFAPPSKAVWALVDKWRERSGEEGLHYVLKNALLNHAIELDEALGAPPLAESVGDGTNPLSPNWKPPFVCTSSHREVMYYGEGCPMCELQEVLYLDERKHVGREGWVKCSERMPEPDTQCWVALSLNGISRDGQAYAIWTGEDWFLDLRDSGDFYTRQAAIKDGLDVDEVTHWMPLPPPPRT